MGGDHRVSGGREALGRLAWLAARAAALAADQARAGPAQAPERLARRVHVEALPKARRRRLLNECAYVAGVEVRMVFRDTGADASA